MRQLYEKQYPAMFVVLRQNRDGFVATHMFPASDAVEHSLGFMITPGISSYFA